MSVDVERVKSILHGIRMETECSRASSAREIRSALERIRSLSIVGLSLIADRQQVEVLQAEQRGEGF